MDTLAFQTNAARNRYLYMADDQIHWFSILNSLMIVLFLAGLVAMIIMRTLHNDFRRYEQMEASEEEAQEETGWKLVCICLYTVRGCTRLFVCQHTCPYTGAR